MGKPRQISLFEWLAVLAVLVVLLGLFHPIIKGLNKPLPRPTILRLQAVIHEELEPRMMESKYAFPLHQALEEKGYGQVTSIVESADKKSFLLEITLTGRDEGLVFTKLRLRELGAAPNTEIRYKVGRKDFLEILGQ